jgi:hypothetical protein
MVTVAAVARNLRRDTFDFAGVEVLFVALMGDGLVQGVVGGESIAANRK